MIVHKKSRKEDVNFTERGYYSLLRGLIVEEGGLTIELHGLEPEERGLTHKIYESILHLQWCWVYNPLLRLVHHE